MLKLFKILISLTRAINRLAAAQEAIALQAEASDAPAPEAPAPAAATFHQTTPTSIWSKTNYE